LTDDTIGQVNRYLPIIYVPKERKGRALLGALVERFDDFYLLWYHWPYNDYTRNEDYEPISLFILGERLVAVGIRPGNRYVLVRDFPSEEGRPVVVFETPWHHPRIPHPDSLRFAVTRTQAFHDKHIVYEVVGGRPPSYYYVAGSGIDVRQWSEEASSGLKGSGPFTV